MPFNADVERDQNIARLKQRAFSANRRAKVSKDQTREALYRTKDAAINALLTAGRAFVNGVDWSASDPTVGISFIGGGRLHTKLSALDLSAFRNVRLQVASRPIRELRTAGFDYFPSEAEASWRN
jgi:hypothetical protein